MSAKKRNGNAVSSGKSDGWIGFANIDLDKADRQALLDGALDIEEGLEVCASILAQGHKISLSLNHETGSITVAATGVREDCRNKGYTLSSFASDIPKAIIVLAYKHHVKARGNWSSVSRVRVDEDWG